MFPDLYVLLHSYSHAVKQTFMLDVDVDGLELLLATRSAFLHWLSLSFYAVFQLLFYCCKRHHGEGNS